MMQRVLCNLVLILLSLIAGHSVCVSQTSSLLDEGVKLLSQGRFDEAVTVFNRFKQTNPQDARAYFYCGLALTESARLSAAALELGEALRLEPEQTEYLILQASVYARLKQKSHVEDTLAIFQKAGAIENLESSWLWLLVDAYYRVEQLDNALRTLDLMEKRFPDDPRLALNRGQVYVIQNKIDLAMESFRKSIAKHPANALAHFELGKLLYQNNEIPAAKSALLEAVRLEKKNPKYLQKLGTVCLSLKEVEEAIPYLESALALDPNSMESNYSLGQAWQRKGDRQKAVEYIQKFQELKRREELAGEIERTLARGERMLDEGNPTEAAAAFKQIVQLDSNNWTAHAYLAEMFLEGRDWQKAWPHLAKMEELDAESVVGNYLMVRHWFLRKDFGRARDYGEKVKQSRPGHAELRNLLGRIYLGLSQPEKARDEFEAAVRLAPERADFREDLQKIKLTK
ncbi:MAG: tetratricopeptide repeat protein [Acidobacteria bacterium]|nr:tetratricopeptide repeat protein [Acidobacteriota bacterium]